jgi:hypothetical protein
LLLECVEIGVGRNLERESNAIRLAAAPQHHGMMIDCRRQIRRVLFLGDERQPQNVGEVLRLLIEIGRLVGGVSDLMNADHS